MAAENLRERKRGKDVRADNVVIAVGYNVVVHPVCTGGDVFVDGRSLAEQVVFFFGFFMMAFQFAGQAIFVGLGKAKNAVFFSIFRKVIIVIPLIIILPSMFHMGTDGILMAEPVSNFIGGTACFVTMLCTVWPELTKGERDKNK